MNAIGNATIYKDLGSVFDRYVRLASSKVVTDEINFASEKAMSMLMRDVLGKGYNYVNENYVLPILSEAKVPNKLKRTDFCSENYFADLAACKIELDKNCARPPRDDPQVILEGHVLMVKVAMTADYEDRSTQRCRAPNRWETSSMKTGRRNKHVNMSTDKKKDMDACQPRDEQHENNVDTTKSTGAHKTSTEADSEDERLEAQEKNKEPNEDTGAQEKNQEPNEDTGAQEKNQEPNEDTGAQEKNKEPNEDTGAQEKNKEPNEDTGAQEK